MELKPVIDDLINSETLLNHVDELLKKTEPIPHSDILHQLIEEFETLDFEVLTFPEVKHLLDQEHVFH